MDRNAGKPYWTTKRNPITKKWESVYVDPRTAAPPPAAAAPPPPPPPRYEPPPRAPRAASPRRAPPPTAPRGGPRVPPGVRFERPPAGEAPRYNTYSSYVPGSGPSWSRPPPPPPSGAPRPPRSASAPPPRGGPRGPPPPSGPPPAARAPVAYTEENLMRTLGRILTEASAGNLAGAKDAVDFLIREKDGFIAAIRAERINKRDVKSTAKSALFALHPDKGGDADLFGRMSDLLKGDNFGILSGSAKPRKCRKCGLPKY